MNHIDRNSADGNPHATAPDESRPDASASRSQALTDEVSFRAALQAVLVEASANDVDVTGGWLLEGPDGEVWNLLVTEPLDDASAVRSEDTPIVETVARTVAERIGVSPVELPPLYDAVDPELLTSLVESDTPTKRTVTFEYAGYDVVVESDGTIHIRA